MVSQYDLQRVLRRLEVLEKEVWQSKCTDHGPIRGIFCEQCGEVCKKMNSSAVLKLNEIRQDLENIGRSNWEDLEAIAVDIMDLYLDYKESDNT